MAEYSKRKVMTISLSKKEYKAIMESIDFMTTNCDGADEDKYPHDTLKALWSVIEKYKSERYKNEIRKETMKIENKTK